MDSLFKRLNVTGKDKFIINSMEIGSAMALSQKDNLISYFSFVLSRIRCLWFSWQVHGVYRCVCICSFCQKEKIRRLYSVMIPGGYVGNAVIPNWNFKLLEGEKSCFVFEGLFPWLSKGLALFPFSSFYSNHVSRPPCVCVNENIYEQAEAVTYPLLWWRGAAYSNLRHYFSPRNCLSLTSSSRVTNYEPEC